MNSPAPWRETAPLGRKSHRAPQLQGWSMMRRWARGPLLPRCWGRHRQPHRQPQPGQREELERGQTQQPGPQPQPGERTAQTDTPHQQCSSYDIRPAGEDRREEGGGERRGGTLDSSGDIFRDNLTKSNMTRTKKELIKIPVKTEELCLVGQISGRISAVPITKHNQVYGSSTHEVLLQTCKHTHCTVKNTNMSLQGWIKRVDDLAVETYTVGSALPFPADICTQTHRGTHSNAHTIACWAAPPRLWQTITITDTVRVRQQLDFESQNTHTLLKKKKKKHVQPIVF